MKNRLTRSDWLEFGLKRLVKSGAGSLKAEPMAKAMNVSRGSFYWHFEDIDAFRSGVLRLWRDKATTQVVEDVEKEQKPDERLVKLLNIAFRSNIEMDRAVRAWAIHDSRVAESVAEVDAVRIQYLETIFSDYGFGPEDARTRAVLIYWAFLGQIQMPAPKGAGIKAVDVALMVRLLMQKV